MALNVLVGIEAPRSERCAGDSTAVQVRPATCMDCDGIDAPRCLEKIESPQERLEPGVIDEVMLAGVSRVTQ